MLVFFCGYSLGKKHSSRQSKEESTETGTIEPKEKAESTKVQMTPARVYYNNL